jgi:hypothetical protein
MKRVFEIDVSVCPHCGGTRKLIALVTDASDLPGFLLHLGLDNELPLLSPTRALEESVFAGEVPDGGSMQIAGLVKRAHVRSGAANACCCPRKSRSPSA